MRKAGFILFVLLFTTSCSGFIDSLDEKPELTSPCAGAEGSPCGPKRPVNLWLHQNAQGEALS